MVNTFVFSFEDLLSRSLSPPSKVKLTIKNIPILPLHFSLESYSPLLNRLIWQDILSWIDVEWTQSFIVIYV